jgi:hypothetical protein
MENSCRKKHKPSPKKWILASRYSEFRRNPALVPANAGLFHYAGNNPVRYIDPDGRETKEDKARWRLYEAAFFIITTAKTDDEKVLAKTVKDMMNKKKVQLDDMSKRSDGAVFRTSKRKGFFNPYKNETTGEFQNIIVIDINLVLGDDFGEIVEVLAHEAWHKVQMDKGQFEITSDNKFKLYFKHVEGKSFYDYFTDFELEAYNVGVIMNNKFRESKNFDLYSLYSWDTIRDLYPED